MHRHKSSRRAAITLSIAALGLTGWGAVADASGTGTHGVNRVEQSNVVVDDPIRIRSRGDAQVIVAHITVDPGGHTPWHYHPGPHIVSVKSGTVEVYETDCSVRTHEAGVGFFDPGLRHRPHIHTLRNPSPDTPAEVVIVDIREEDLPPTVVADPQPRACFS